ncbi:MAG: aminotransferase class I/II-fold pyridoxal phosphate-dependent enzyme, partial [Spirochaetaceae bacterium]
VQAQEAAKNATRYNVTAGIARKKNKPLRLAAMSGLISGLTEKESVDYAPTGGLDSLREQWKQGLILKNPGLKNISFSLPLVSAGISHGIFVVSDLFADENTTVVIPAPSWENYSLIFKERWGAEYDEYPFYNSKNGFNIDGLRNTISTCRTDKIICILNFPHNPTGYTPLADEAWEICHVLRDAAEAGKKMLALCDDAYFGLFWEKEIFHESIFALCAELHPNLLAVKLDGATKEDFAWGLRVGFVTFAGKGLTEKHLDAITGKALASIRASVSSASMAGQQLLLKAMASPGYMQEKENALSDLASRYKAVREFVSLHPHKALYPMGFNSGYFLCMRTAGIDAQVLRRKLLDDKGIGTVAIGKEFLRVAWSCVDEEDIAPLFTEIWAAADGLAGTRR